MRDPSLSCSKLDAALEVRDGVLALTELGPRFSTKVPSVLQALTTFVGDFQARA